MANPIKNQLPPTKEVQQAGSEDHDAADNIDKNTDDLSFKEVKEFEGRPDWDFKKLEFVHSLMGDYIIKQGKVMTNHVSRELLKEPSKPRVPDILIMFKEAMRSPEAKNYIPMMEKIQQHSPGSIDDLLKAKYSFEQSSHKAQAEFSLNSLKAGTGIETALINWDFAVQSFSEAKENAEATFKEAVYAARADVKNDLEKKYSSLANEILAHENHFNYASKVAGAVDSYGKVIAKANSDLAAAFSILITELVKNWNLSTQGETTLIMSNRKDSLSLWTAIKNSFNKKIGVGRTV